MARTSETPAQDILEQTAPTGEQSANGTEEASKDKTIGVRVSPEFFALIEEQAKVSNLTAASWVRQQVANLVGYELPPSARGAERTKYATEEERKAAAKAKAAERNKTVSALLDLYRNDPELAARIQAAMTGAAS